MLNTMHTDTARDQMVHQQLRAWHVLSQPVLDTFARIPREAFVPPAFRDVAHADTGIPLGGGDHMLAPKIGGRILQAVAPKPTDRVLEIGSGSCAAGDGEPPNCRGAQCHHRASRRLCTGSTRQQ